MMFHLSLSLKRSQPSITATPPPREVLLQISKVVY